MEKDGDSREMSGFDRLLLVRKLQDMMGILGKRISGGNSERLEFLGQCLIRISPPTNEELLSRLIMLQKWIADLELEDMGLSFDKVYRQEDMDRVENRFASAYESAESRGFARGFRDARHKALVIASAHPDIEAKIQSLEPFEF